MVHINLCPDLESNIIIPNKTKSDKKSGTIGALRISFHQVQLNKIYIIPEYKNKLLNYQGTQHLQIYNLMESFLEILMNIHI